MTRREIDFVRSLSKNALSGSGTIELRRNRRGDIFFTTRHDDGFATWHLYPRGEEWLKLHGFEVGDKIGLSVALHLQQHGMSYTGGSSRRPQSVRQTNVAQDAEHFDWAAATGIEQRLGAIRSNTVTIRKDGSVTTTNDRDVVRGSHPSPTSPVHSRRRGPASSHPQDIKLRKEIAQLVDDKRRFEEERKRSGTLPLLEQNRRKEPARSSKQASNPIVVRDTTESKRRIERQPSTRMATAVEITSPDTHDDHSRASVPTTKLDDVVTAVMAKLATSAPSEPQRKPRANGSLGVPRKLQKKAAKRKKK